MSEDLHSDETVVLSPRKFMTHPSQYILDKLKYVVEDSFSQLDDNHLRGVNYKDLKPGIVLEEVLQNAKYEPGIACHDLNTKQLLGILSDDEENIKRNIETLKQAIHEETESLNKMQVRINRLKCMRAHKTSETNLQFANLELRKRFKVLKKDLNDLIEELFPARDDDVKVILLDLVATSPSNSDTYPYIKVTNEYSIECLEILLSCNIIETHPELSDLIKLRVELV